MTGSDSTRGQPSGLQSVLDRLGRWLRRRRMPVVLQMAAAECGPACLAMILGYYGRPTRISESREYCDAGRDGVTALDLAEAARSLGLRVKAYSLEPADFRYVSLPAVIHWQFNHFLVVERWSPIVIDVVDPASGRRRLTAAEFDAGFTGVVLTFEPGSHFEPRRATAGALGWKYLRNILRVPGAVGALLQVLAASLLLQALGLVLPVLTKAVVDTVLPLRITSVLGILGAGILILTCTQMITTYLRSALLIYVQGRVDAQIMLGFFEHLLTLPLRFFHQRSTGDLLMRLSSNMMIRQALTNQTMSAVFDGTLVLTYLLILLSQSPSLGVLTLSVGMLQAALILGTARRVHDLTQRDISTSAESHSYLVEALTGIATLKASGAEDRALDHWSNLFYKYLNVSLERSHFSALLDTALAALRTLSPLALLWVGAYLVLHGAMSLGTMLGLTALAGAFLGPLASLLADAQQLLTVKAHLERIADVTEAEPEQRPGDRPKPPRLTGRIEVQQVSFRYSPSGPLVLQDLSLQIEPEQKVALVGRTGAGKSTLAMLLLGLYEPSEGQILYDGLPLPALDYRAVRRQFGAVLQEPFLFKGSIRQNIAFNDPAMPLEQVQEAARMAAIHDDILGLPMGYETLIGEGGGGLSGGQRQRLSLARALSHRPAILLLDEATSHLDVVTEGLVDQNLSRLPCTRIVIAHRLSTIQNSDQILMLEAGKIVERGTHEELLAQQGCYAALVRSQLGTR